MNQLCRNASHYFQAQRRQFLRKLLLSSSCSSSSPLMSLPFVNIGTNAHTHTNTCHTSFHPCHHNAAFCSWSSSNYIQHCIISPTVIQAQARTLSTLTQNRPSQEGERQQQFHEKVTDRILNTQIGDLNQASLFELTTTISSWHREIIKDSDLHSHSHSHSQQQVHAFHQANALLERLLQEFVFYCDNDGEGGRPNSDNKITIKIEIDTLNLVLDCWRIINNSGKVHGKQQHPSQPQHHPKVDDQSNEISFSNLGLDVLTKYNAIVQKYDDQHGHEQSKSTITISHADTKSYNIILDGYSKLGMVDEAEQLFDDLLMPNTNDNDNNNTSTQSKNQFLQCRPNNISYNTLLSTYANSITNQVENAEKASELLDDMLQLYNATGNLDIKPDVITFATVIGAYANAASLSSDAPYQAEHILKSMIEMYNSTLIENGGDGEWVDLKPNHVCFTSLISAWNNSGLSDAVDRAANVLGYMQTIGGGGNGSITMENMSALISSYSNADGEDSPEEAVNLMHKMLSIAESTGDASMMPNTVTFTALIDCLAQSAGRKIGGDGGEAALMGETILKKMEEIYEAGHEQARPTTPVYNALINAWAKSMRPDAGEKAEEWLRIMEKLHLSGQDVKPDAITFSSVILAYANADNGVDAERILMQMYDAYQRGETDCEPNVISFSAAINAYANRGEPREAERLLSLRDSLPGLDAFEPDPYCLNCVLKAYTKSNEEDSVKKALNFLEKMDDMGMSTAVAYSSVIEMLSKVGKPWAEQKGIHLLERMWTVYDQGGEQVKPNMIVYTSLINLLSKSNNPKVSGKTLDLLNELLQKYDETKDMDFLPNTVTFNAALSAFAKASGGKNDIEKAEKILEQMEELYDQGYNDVKPDAFSLTNVISCYANSKTDGAASRAEEILQHMQTLYDENGDKSMRPTKVAFGAVLNAWAREGNSHRAQAIVDHMESLQDTYDEMATNTVIYNTLINSWTKNGVPESGRKAEEILFKMQELHKNGKADIRPTKITYNSVLAAYQKSGEEDAYVNAKHLLKEMEDNADPSIHPDVVTYATFLNLVSKWKNPQKVDVAEQMLEKMATKKIKPNNFAYDAAMRVCVQTYSRNQKIRRKALILGVKTLSTMQDSSHVIPTSYTYSLFFTLILKHSSGNEVKKLLTRSLQDCCKAGLLTNLILDQLKRKVPPSFLEKILFPEGDLKEICIQNLPQEWSQHSQRKLPTALSQRKAARTQHDTGRRKIRKR